MAQRSPQFGLVPNLRRVFDDVVRQADRQARSKLRAGEALVAGVVDEGMKLARATEAELRARGAVPPSRSTAKQQVAPRKPGSGGAASSARRPASKTGPRSRNAAVAPEGADLVREAALQADAFVRGVADTLAFSKMDEMVAGANAALDFSDRSFGEKFRDYHQRELARDQYDSQHRALARGAGQAAGVVPFLATGGLTAALRAAAPRTLRSLRGSGPLRARPRLQTTSREVVATSVGAGLVNGVGNGVADLATGGKGSAADAAGAFVGGVVAGPVAIYRAPTAAGAVEGAVTSISQDLISGRPISYAAAAQKAGGSALAGTVGDHFGSRLATNLSTKTKGKLGEGLSVIKTRLRGELPIGRHERRQLSRGHTFLDPGSTATGAVESKMGFFAELSPAQLLAQLELGPASRVDWWLSPDFGKITGSASSSLFGNLSGRDEGH